MFIRIGSMPCAFGAFGLPPLYMPKPCQTPKLPLKNKKNGLSHASCVSRMSAILSAS